jgi:hypothetical protein
VLSGSWSRVPQLDSLSHVPLDIQVSTVFT